jgi:hypothetical protein
VTRIIPILILLVCGCRLVGYQSERNRKAETTLSDSPGARQTNISFGDAAPWGIFAMAGAGWGYSAWGRRRNRQALDRTIRAIEWSDTPKKFMRLFNDGVEKVVNRRVRQVTGKR